jgi:hypothetical protein
MEIIPRKNLRFFLGAAVFNDEHAGSKLDVVTRDRSQARQTADSEE